MSLGDGELHAFAGAGVGILTVGCVVGLLTFHSCAGDASAEPDHNPLEDMEAIEASIAYKKSPAKQPQKRTRPPDPVKQEGLSRDAEKLPDPKQDKKEDKKKPVDQKTDKPIPDRSNFDENDPVNDKPVTDVGAFEDTKRGFAEVTAGEPFFRELAADFHEIWQWPSILQTQASAAACLHILADGTIEKIKVDPKSGEPQLDESLDAGLKQLQQKRKQNPTPVPTYLLKQATTRWICFRAKTPSQ